jgi:hypothetical protein
MATSNDPESYIDILCNYPAIDNHAHPLLTAENRNRLAFEGLTSEAEGPALDDAVYTLPHSTARRDLVSSVRSSASRLVGGHKEAPR